MKKLNNDYIKHIKGYLNALDNISGMQNEFDTKILLISSQNKDSISEIKTFYTFLDEPKIIKEKKYFKCYGISIFLYKLLLIKPFSKFKEYEENHNMSSKYKDYILFNLSDYIDMAFEDEGVNWKSLREVEILLLKDKNHNCIAVTYTRENIKLFMFFFRKNYDDNQFLLWFDEIIDSIEIKFNELNKKRIRKNI